MNRWTILLALALGTLTLLTRVDHVLMATLGSSPWDATVIVGAIVGLGLLIGTAILFHFLRGGNWFISLVIIVFCILLSLAGFGEAGTRPNTNTEADTTSVKGAAEIIPDSVPRSAMPADTPQDQEVKYFYGFYPVAERVLVFPC